VTKVENRDSCSAGYRLAARTILIHSYVIYIQSCVALYTSCHLGFQDLIKSLWLLDPLLSKIHHKALVHRPWVEKDDTGITDTVWLPAVD
jgi:hypothetical protein